MVSRSKSKMDDIYFFQVWFGLPSFHLQVHPTQISWHLPAFSPQLIMWELLFYPSMSFNTRHPITITRALLL